MPLIEFVKTKYTYNKNDDGGYTYKREGIYKGIIPCDSFFDQMRIKKARREFGCLCCSKTKVKGTRYVGDNWNTNIGDLINEDIKNVSINEPFDLVLFIDILEHLSYEDLDIVLKKEQNKDSKFIFSIPFLGDPNLDADSTHIIKEDKECG